MAYNEELCKKIHNQLEKDLGDIKHILNGNGTTGMSAKVDAVWKYYINETATRAGLLDWVFRAIITIMISYIAIKLGLS